MHGSLKNKIHTKKNTHAHMHKIAHIHKIAQKSTHTHKRQPSFLTPCPNQRSRLYRNKVCMLLIPSFLRRESELMWSFKRTLHVHRIIARSLHCSLSRSLTLGAQHSLAYNRTVRIYMLYICPRVMYERAREVNIGKSSRNCPTQIEFL